MNGFTHECRSGAPGTHWRQRLLEAADAPALLTALGEITAECPGVARAWVVWEFGHAVLGQAGNTMPSPEAIAVADRAALARGPVSDADTGLVSVPMPASTATVVLEPESAEATPAILGQLREPWAAADRLLARELQLAELHQEVSRLQYSEQLQRALFDISELSFSDLDMADVLRGVHSIVGSLMYAENLFIVMRDLAADTFEMLYFADAVDDPPFTGALPLEDIQYSATWHVMRGGRALRGTPEQLEAQVNGPMRTYGTDCHQWMGVPIMRDGQSLGAIVVQSYTEEAGFSSEDQGLLEFVASHILTALERKRSTELLERSVEMRTQQLAAVNRALQQQVVERERAERLQAALFEIARLATEDIDSGEFHARVHRVVGRLLNADNFYIGLLSDDGDRLEFPYYVDTCHPRLTASRPLARGLSELVLRSREPLLGTPARIAELEAAGEIEYRQEQGAPSACWLGAPLLSGEQVIGLVAVQSYTNEDEFGAIDMELLTFVASQIAYAVQRRRATEFQQQAYTRLEERVAERTAELRREIRERERIQDRLRHQVMHDALTGLPNRDQLRLRLGQAMERTRETPVRHSALLYLDVDRFKVINDSLGHLAGDDFLCEVARRLQSCVRQPDLVARLAGDEFAILIEDVALDADGRPVAAIAVAERALEALTEPMEMAGCTLEPSASIGIAVTRPHQQHIDDLVRDADTALYRAKALGRKRWQLYDDSLQHTAVDQLTVEGELRLALKRDEIEPWFQPIVRLGDGAIVGHEALMRWRHPERGVLAPADFLRVAEDSGLIESMDWRLFKRAFLAAAAREDGTYLSINVAPRHLQRSDFTSRLLGLLERTGLAPERLRIEVTEGSLLENPERVRGVLQRLLDAGVGVALDDFGTGYSSLSYLHSFPLRILKMDRTFLADLHRQGNSGPVIQAVVGLAHALGMDVVAEGVEIEEQRAALLELGCGFGQGFLFGRPAEFADQAEPALPA